MSENPFKTGDVVQVKSCGPRIGRIGCLMQNSHTMTSASASKSDSAPSLEEIGRCQQCLISQAREAT